MVILAILTTIAYSYRDFHEAQKKNWLLAGEGVGTLAKKFLNDVVSGTVTTTLEDLKDLRQPFEKLEKTEVLIEHKTTGSDDDSEGGRREFNTQMYEKPHIIPNFIPK